MVILVLDKHEVALLRYLSQYELDNPRTIKKESFDKLATIIVKLDNAL